MGRLTRGALILAIAVAGAGASRASAGPSQLVSVTIAMGYIANVQFAPFYVAQAKGYYRRAGLDVHFQYGIEPDLLRLASAGKVDFVNSGGDEVLTAGARGLHVTYVLTQYTRFPAALFSLRQTGIRRVGDLRNRTIGIPGTFGASYVGLLALLQQNGIPASNVSIKSIGFKQVQAVAHHRVDAAVGYANNEPVFLRQSGYRIQEFDIYHWANIAGAGIAAGNAEIAQHPAVVRAFVSATVRGMEDTLRNPDQAFQIAEQAVPEIRNNAREHRAVLLRSLDFWRPERGHRLGWIDSRIWNVTAHLLYQFKQIPTQVSATAYFTNRFLPSTDR